MLPPTEFLARASDYAGQGAVSMAAAELPATSSRGRTSKQKVTAEWVDFFTSGPSDIATLVIHSRVTQPLADSLSAQTQLSSLDILDGAFRDIEFVRNLTGLVRLSLDTPKVESLDPVATLPRVEVLAIDRPFSVVDLGPLSNIVSLSELRYGNARLSDDRSVAIPDMEWARPLQSLTTLWMPGTRILSGDLSPLLEIPNLVELNLPLRPAYRRQVFELGERSGAFANMAAKYLEHDDYRARH